MEETNTQTQYVDDFADYELQGDAKHDVGQTRFKGNKNKPKREPLWKITKDSIIPEEPQEKHDKPNESKHNKEIEEFNKKIEEHKKSLNDLYDKKKKVKSGGDPDFEKVITRIRDIKTELDELNKNKLELQSTIEKPLQKEKELKAEKEKIEKDLTYKNLEKAQADVLQMQDQLGFSQLSVGEEKKLMDKKKKVEEQIPKLKKLSKVRDELNKVRNDNKEPLDKLAAVRKQITAIVEERKVLFAKKDEFNKNHTIKNEELTLLESQITSIKEANRALRKERDDKEYEYNNKWYKYEAYMKEVEYIRAAKKKQHELIKREEKMAKKAEKLAKKEGANVPAEINLVQTGETVEVIDCKALIGYFQSYGKNEDKTENTETNTENALSDKIKNDLNKGLVTLVDREQLNNDQFLGIESKNKKKKKGPKISKREQKSLNTDLLILGVDILNQIKNIGLNPPSKKSEVEAFINTLEERLTELKVQAEEEAKKQIEAAEEKAKAEEKSAEAKTE